MVEEDDREWAIEYLLLRAMNAAANHPLDQGHLAGQRVASQRFANPRADFLAK
jgi:hypothetical protein